MNKVILIGNLTKDPELTTTTSGISVCRFTLAVQRRFASQDGERGADFLSITVWRGQADNCAKYLKKGSKAAVVGSIQTRTYDAQDGTKRYVTEIVADEVEFIGSRPTGDDGENENAKPTATKKAPISTFEPIDDDNLPF
ncbi:MAG: single-stranded DNA-binding protein [Clostridia bacterium]